MQFYHKRHPNTGTNTERYREWDEKTVSFTRHSNWKVKRNGHKSVKECFLLLCPLSTYFRFNFTLSPRLIHSLVPYLTPRNTVENIRSRENSRWIKKKIGNWVPSIISSAYSFLFCRVLFFLLSKFRFLWNDASLLITMTNPFQFIRTGNIYTASHILWVIKSVRKFLLIYFIQMVPPPKKRSTI